MSTALNVSAPAPVDREFYGRARDLRRRVEREDAKFFPTINSLIAPIDGRLRKFPERKMRPEMLADLIQSWRFLDCRDFRLNLDAKLERTRCALVERRVFAGRTRFLDADWDGEEPDVASLRSACRSPAIGSICAARYCVRSRCTPSRGVCSVRRTAPTRHCCMT